MLIKLMVPLLAALLLVLTAAAAVFLSHSAGSQVLLGSLLALPAQEPPAPAAASPVSLRLFFAMLCLSVISPFSIIGAIALRRHFDSIRPDR